MKRIISILVVTMLAIGILSGCSMKNNSYSDEEKQVIKEANQMISSKYNVTFDEDDFSYSVGKQISENEFVSLNSKEKQESGFENIVSVSALKKSSHKKGELYEFSVTFNSKTKEIINISASIE